MIGRPTSLIVSVSALSEAQGPLGARETVLLEGARPARVREFTAGRVLARRALASIGFHQTDIGQASSGAPIWPAGSCGSITHSSTHAGVAVAQLSHVCSLGIDIDDGRNLDAATKDVVSQAELRELQAHPLARDEATAARLAFCAKEALYKCQMPLTGNSELSFVDIALHLRTDGVLRGQPVGSLSNLTSSAVSAILISIEQFQGVTIAIAWKPSSADFV